MAGSTTEYVLSVVATGLLLFMLAVLFACAIYEMWKHRW